MKITWLGHSAFRLENGSAKISSIRFSPATPVLQGRMASLQPKASPIFC